MPKNDTQRGRWHYLDLEEMSKVTGAEPVMIDADSSCDVPGGPIGGQSRVTLRNEHLQYTITWSVNSSIPCYLVSDPVVLQSSSVCVRHAIITARTFLNFLFYFLAPWLHGS